MIGALDRGAVGQGDGVDARDVRDRRTDVHGEDVVRRDLRQHVEHDTDRDLLRNDRALKRDDTAVRTEQRRVADAEEDLVAS